MSAKAETPAAEVVSRLLVSNYGVAPRSTDFLQHSGSMTWRVTDSRGGSYAFRVYTPISPFTRGPWQHPDAVRSEMMWISHLFHETDIDVQEPLRTLSGDWIALLRNDAGEDVPCALLRWVEGEARDRTYDRNEADRAGRLLARLHNAWRAFAPPAGFVRPRYDAAYLRHALQTAKAHVELEVISAADFALIEDSSDIALSLMDALGEAPEHWGLIHGDFAPFNLVIDGERMIPIDFSESGFGHYIQDVGMILLRIGTEKRALLDAYLRLRHMSGDVERMAEAFAIIHIVHWLAFTAPLPDRHEKVARLTREFVLDRCRQFLAEDSFLFPAPTRH